ncbi:YibE/F family protein [Quadrisphaera granulorum]|uniref:YibE/F family protein n=1 Tax=Quadrisphaera granulorum TaxID=317664 RepID=UPI000E6AF6D5|nr:YibE/F family protein [Quadrisphaera granulorum]
MASDLDLTDSHSGSEKHLGHGHVRPDGSRPGDDVRVGATARRVVVVLALLCALGSAVGVALLWPPAGTLTTLREQVASGGSVVTDVEARAESLQQQTCPGTSLDRLPDGTIPASASCPILTATVLQGPSKGQQVQVPVPAQVAEGGITPGDRVDLGYFPPTPGYDATWQWVDFSRTRPLGLAVGAFALLTVLVARKRGLAALGGMVLAGAVLAFFMIPALLAGKPPLLVSVTGCTAIMSVVLYLTHGFSLRTAAAHLGTVSGLVLVGVAAHVAVGATHLQGLSDEDSAYLGQLTSMATLRGLVVAGIVLAGVGVLNDVTITQASAVWEVREHAPGASFTTLVRSGMRVGRDHLASTVYTVAFAYAGAALPVLVILAVTDPRWIDAVSSSALAEEIVRTAIGGACVALSVPITTAVAAAAVASASVQRPAAGGAPESHDHAAHPVRDHGTPPPSPLGRRAQRAAEQRARRRHP